MEQIRTYIADTALKFQTAGRIRSFTSSGTIAENVIANLIVTLPTEYLTSFTFFLNGARVENAFIITDTRTDFIVGQAVKERELYAMMDQALTAQEIGIRNEGFLKNSLDRILKKNRKKTHLRQFVHASRDDDFHHGIDFYVVGSANSEERKMPLSVKMSMPMVPARSDHGRIMADKAAFVIPTLVYDYRHPCSEESLLRMLERLFDEWLTGTVGAYYAKLKF